LLKELHERGGVGRSDNKNACCVKMDWFPKKKANSVSGNSGLTLAGELRWQNLAA